MLCKLLQTYTVWIVNPQAGLIGMEWIHLQDDMNTLAIRLVGIECCRIVLFGEIVGCHHVDLLQINVFDESEKGRAREEKDE